MVCLLLVASGAGAAQNNIPRTATRSPRPRRPPVQVWGRLITQSTNPDHVTAGNSVSCNNGAAGGFLHTDNSYYRAFTLSAFNPPLDQLQFAVQSVTFGIEQANAAGVGTTQPITVNIYNSSANPPTLATLGPVLGTVTVKVPDQVHTLFTATLPAPVVFTVATGILVVEIFTPSGQAATGTRSSSARTASARAGRASSGRPPAASARSPTSPRSASRTCTW